MNRYGLGACGISAVIAFMSCVWASNSPPAGSLGAQEARYQKIQQASQKLSDSKDWRGKSMRDDVQANVLKPPARAEIERLRSLAQTQAQKGQADAARETVSALTVALDREVQTFQGISAYWSSGAQNTPDRTSYLDYLRKNGIEPRRVEEIKAAQQKLAEQLEAGQFAAVASQAYPALQQLMATAEQEENDALIAKFGTAGFTPFLELRATGKCSSPGGTSGTSTPKWAGTMPGQSYYPAASRRLAEEGMAYVMVEVSAKGCAERAVITATSGYPRLDEATLQMMVESSYLPAVENGRAVAATLFTKMKWELKD